MTADRKAKILVVDDEIVSRDYISSVLRREGYDVYNANDGNEGISRTLEVRPDLILTDVAMPTMSGFEMCRRLRRDTRTDAIPIIFATVCLNEDDYRTGLSLGVEDYLAKPLRSAELIARVRAALPTGETPRPRPALPAPGVTDPTSRDLFDPVGGRDRLRRTSESDLIGTRDAQAGRVGFGGANGPAGKASSTVWQSNVLFSGSLATTSVVDVLQTLAPRAITGTLQISGYEKAWVDIDHGRVVRAKVTTDHGAHRGMKAWLRIANWTEGIFELLDSSTDDEPDSDAGPNIDLPLRTLALEAALYRDEVARLRAGIPDRAILLKRGDLTAAAPPVDRAIVSAAERAIRLEDLLDELDQSDREILDAVGRLVRSSVIELKPGA